ncbi:MAG: hypothetical protein JST02_01580 [Bacteroidetes bacterium]|nr:hypothetical protein [Bacteroidota bacterium]
MKKLFTIFAFYLLWLTCLPCLCEDSPNDIHTSQSEKHALSNKQTKDDCCSPFCLCACCPAPVVILKHQFTIIPLITINRVDKKPLANQSFLSYRSHNIWQPPRLS